MMRRLTFVLLLAIAAAGCRRSGLWLGHSTYTSFGAATLQTQFGKDPVTRRAFPLVHVLFVPQSDVPRGFGTLTSRGSSGTVERVRLDYTYKDHGPGSHHVSMNAQPIWILDGKRLEEGGRTFDLSAGNIFVAEVNGDGSLRVTQLSSKRELDDPLSVLGFIKESLPENRRVQELKAKS